MCPGEIDGTTAEIEHREAGDEHAADHLPQSWARVLEKSDDDIAAGRLVSGEIVVQALRSSIARLEARNVPEEATSGA